MFNHKLYSMRYLLLITFLVIKTSLYAQTVEDKTAKKAAIAAALLADKFDKHTGSIKDVPEKFKNESVVVLFHSANFFIERGEEIFFVERVKSRVYLKDKAAVEKYSTYYTSAYGERNSSDVTIIKPNGTSKTLELKDGIKETNYASVPTYYKSSVTLNQTYYKFALPDLEPGDIIDFTQIAKNPMGVLTGNIPFSKIYLVSNFPIVKTFITIEVPTKDSYIYIKSLNGAPDMKRTQGENGLVTFSLEDSLRNKIGNDWNLPEEKILPHVKFILTRYTGSDNSEVLPMRTSTTRISTQFTQGEWDRSAKQMIPLRKAGSTAAKYIMAEIIAKNPAAKNDINKLIELTWCYIRERVINDQRIMAYEYVSGSNYDIYIADIFAEILLKKKQTFDLIFTTGNKNGGINNVICPKEISWGIRWNGKYLMYPAYYMQFGELSNYYAGADALIVQNFNFKMKTFPFKDFTLPAYPYNENTLNEEFKISLNEDFDKIICNKSTVATKGFSGTFISDYYNRDFNIEQLKYINLYVPVDSSSLYKGLNKKETAEAKRKNDEAQAKYAKAVYDTYKELVKSDYPMLDEYKSWKFNSYGMTPTAPEFSMEETFTLNDLVKKAGNGYMITIGALFGDYDKVQEDFRKRNYNGSLDVATVKTATVIFEIPQGYKVSSLESANKTFSDNFVSLKSSLKVDGNKVVFTITREIKKTDFTIDEYPSMVKYYDAMYELTQVKIVVKK